MPLCKILLWGRDEETAFVFVLSTCPATIPNTQIPDFIHVGFCLIDTGADLIERFWSLILSGHLLRCLVLIIRILCLLTDFFYYYYCWRSYRDSLRTTGYWLLFPRTHIWLCLSLSTLVQTVCNSNYRASDTLLHSHQHTFTQWIVLESWWRWLVCLFGVVFELFSR